jgi:hypothetical protein
MQGRADTPIGLCTDDDQSPDAETGQEGLKRGVLEGVAVVLLDQRLGVARGQLGDDLPALALPRQVLIGVLDPDHGHTLPPGPFDKTLDLRDDRVTLESRVLCVDDEECGVRLVLKCGHDRLVQTPVAARSNDLCWRTSVRRSAGRMSPVRGARFLTPYTGSSAVPETRRPQCRRHLAVA